MVDFAPGVAVGTYTKDVLVQIKPNSGIHAMIATALVRFQLSDPDKVRRGDRRHPIAQLSSETARDAAYDTLVRDDLAPSRVTAENIDEALAEHRFLTVYLEPSP